MSGEDGASPRADFGSERDGGPSQPGPSRLCEEGGEGRRGQSSHVRVLEEQLKAPDAVMEPDILNVVVEYFNSVPYTDSVAGDVIRFLEDGYEGYAHMGSLVCSWLRYVDEKEDEDNEEDRGGRGAKRQRVSNASTASAQMTPMRPTCLTTPTMLASNGTESPCIDEASFLRELVLEKFKPSIFENLFTTGGSGPPMWLNALVAEAEGRALIYDLSTKHDDSLLLSFALKKIVSKGYEDEVAMKDVDLSRYFDVYHGILMVRLRALASTNNEADIQRLCGLIQRSALSSMLGYVHVRQVLTKLAADGDRAQKPWSSRFRRMYQDLEMASRDGLACKMSRFFVAGPDEENDESFLAASVIGDVLATAVGGHVAPTSDVIKLQRLYSGVGLDQASGGEATRVPSVTLLHHPVIIDVLLRSLFNPSKKLRGEALDAHVLVLSIAVCGLDETDKPGGNLGDSKGAALIAKQPQVERLVGLLHVAVSLGHKATEDIVLTEDEKKQVEASMADGICASGTLVLLRRRLTSAEYWSSAYHVHKEPPFLSLLFSIVDKHPDMHGDVLSLIKDAMRSAGNTTAGTHVLLGLVRVLIELCKTELVESVLRWAAYWAKNANAELSRALVFGLLEIAAPPYSPLFVESMIKLMNAAQVRRQSMGSRLWNQYAGLVREFYDNVMSGHANLTLDKCEATYLRDLKQNL